MARLCISASSSPHSLSHAIACPDSRTSSSACAAALVQREAPGSCCLHPPSSQEVVLSIQLCNLIPSLHLLLCFGRLPSHPNLPSLPTHHPPWPAVTIVLCPVCDDASQSATETSKYLPFTQSSVPMDTSSRSNMLSKLSSAVCHLFKSYNTQSDD